MLTENGLITKKKKEGKGYLRLHDEKKKREDRRVHFQWMGVRDKDNSWREHITAGGCSSASGPLDGSDVRGFASLPPGADLTTSDGPAPPIRYDPHALAAREAYAFLAPTNGAQRNWRRLELWPFKQGIGGASSLAASGDKDAQVRGGAAQRRGDRRRAHMASRRRLIAASPPPSTCGQSRGGWLTRTRARVKPHGMVPGTRGGREPPACISDLFRWRVRTSGDIHWILVKKKEKRDSKFQSTSSHWLKTRGNKESFRSSTLWSGVRKATIAPRIRM
jgi:hypothetical protein